MLIMNESMHRLYDENRGTKIGRLRRMRIQHTVKKHFRSVFYDHGCIFTGTHDEDTIETMREFMGDYTGAEAGANEFTINDKLSHKIDFSDVVYFVDEFEKMLAAEFPKLKLETLLSVDKLGDAVFRFYQKRPEELEYCRDIVGISNPVRINTLYNE